MLIWLLGFCFRGIESRTSSIRIMLGSCRGLILILSLLYSYALFWSTRLFGWLFVALICFASCFVNLVFLALLWHADWSFAFESTFAFASSSFLSFSLEVGNTRFQQGVSRVVFHVFVSCVSLCSWLCVVRVPRLLLAAWIAFLCVVVVCCLLPTFFPFESSGHLKSCSIHISHAFSSRCDLRSSKMKCVLLLWSFCFASLDPVGFDRSLFVGAKTRSAGCCFGCFDLVSWFSPPSAVLLRLMGPLRLRVMCSYHVSSSHRGFCSSTSHTGPSCPDCFASLLKLRASRVVFISWYHVFSSWPWSLLLDCSKYVLLLCCFGFFGCSGASDRFDGFGLVYLLLRSLAAVIVGVLSCESFLSLLRRGNRWSQKWRQACMADKRVLSVEEEIGLCEEQAEKEEAYCTGKRTASVE